MTIDELAHRIGGLQIPEDYNARDYLELANLLDAAIQHIGRLDAEVANLRTELRMKALREEGVSS